MELTDSQVKAIEHDGHNLQLIACAGSGKTEVVARRVVHLLTPGRPDSLTPANIVAFTFTEKAAAELKERIVARTRTALGEVPGLAEMFVGTIHAFCLELIKTEVPKYLKYEVLNEVQQGLFVDRHSRASGLTTSTDIAGKALRRYTDTKRYIDALSILREADLEDSALDGCSVVAALELYRDLLDERSYLDYSAILEAAVEALTNDSDLRQRLAERVRYVIVDEYQDVNPIQEAIVWSLHELGASICVVGDDDQTIYQWRGSDVQNILTFAQRYPEVTQVPLEENFRSSDGIVETARDFIEQNTDRLPKAMKPTARPDLRARRHRGALVRQIRGAEARYIAQTCAASREVVVIRDEDDSERGISWSDMAVLLRSVQAERRADHTRTRRGRHPLRRGRHEQPVRDAVKRKRRASSSTSWPSRSGVDAAAVDNCLVGRRSWARARATSPGRSPTRPQPRQALADPDQKRWGFYSIQRVFLDFLEQAGAREELVPNGRGEIVFYNLGKFSQLISDFETIHYHSKPAEKYDSFANFLQYRAEDAYPEGWQDNQYANPDAVRIMTVHQAKGMQWPVVFIPALLKNRFPARKPGGRNVWHILPRAGVKDQARYEGTIEDERRLFYVAMTRSQKFLHLTWAPIPGRTAGTRRASEFWDDVLVSKYVKRRPPDYSARQAARAAARAAGVANVVFSFSDLKYFFECPYQFKLRVLYGFNAPIHEALGYGKSLHDALAEVHARAIRGELLTARPRCPARRDAPAHAVRLSRAQREARGRGGARRPRLHQRQPGALRQNLEFSEKQIEISLGDGVTVIGPDRPRAPHRHRRDDDRRPQVERPRAARGGHGDPAPHLCARLPGAHRPAARLRRDLRARRAEEEAPVGGR